MNFSLIGGDLRLVKLAEMLQQDEHKVYTYALEKANFEEITKCNTCKDAIVNSKIVISSIPFSSDKININTPFSDKTVSMEELFSNMTDKVLIAGSISNAVKGLAKDKRIQMIDVLEREELAVLNAISTAEGTIKILIEETDTTIHGRNILILGFGRCGEVLAKMLHGMGANVFCEARKNEDLAWIKTYGYHGIKLEDLEQTLNQFDIIVNTIPSMILNLERLQLLKKECLIIDLASSPGGVDKEAAKELHLKFIWALALPGKVAPVTSAEYIKDTIYNIVKEISWE